MYKNGHVQASNSLFFFPFFFFSFCAALGTLPPLFFFFFVKLDMTFFFFTWFFFNKLGEFFLVVCHFFYFNLPSFFNKGVRGLRSEEPNPRINLSDWSKEKSYVLKKRVLIRRSGLDIKRLNVNMLNWSRHPRWIWTMFFILNIITFTAARYYFLLLCLFKFILPRMKKFLALYR